MTQPLLKTSLSFLAISLAGCSDRQGPPAPYHHHDAIKATHGIISVQKGDSISKIALRYQASIQDIIKINALAAPYRLYVGQKLFIPGLKPGAQIIAPFDVTVSKLDPKATPTIQIEKLTPDTLFQPDIAPSTAPSITPDIAPNTTPSLSPDIAPGNTIALEHKPIPPKTVPKELPESDLSDDVEDPIMPVPEIPLKKTESPAVAKKETSSTKNTPLQKEDMVKKEESKKEISKKEEIKKEEAPKETAQKSPLAFRWPAHGDIIRPFKKGKNDGINISAPEGSPVFAAEEGTVAYVGDKLPGFGNLIMIKHRNGWMTAYAHTKDVVVKREMKVKKGQEIAKVGQTGNVNAPQLHFEVRKRTQAVDPKPLLE